MVLPDGIDEDEDVLLNDQVGKVFIRPQRSTQDRQNKTKSEVMS